MTMSLREFLAELRHRGVLKVATAYLAGGLVALEAGTHLLHNFEAPHWVLKVFTSVLILGFPIACLMAWGFEFGSTGVHAAVPTRPQTAPEARHTDALFAAVLAAIFLLMTVLVVEQWRRPVPLVAPPDSVAIAPAEGVNGKHTVAMGPPSIAVLPFVDMSAEHDQQYLGDGIAEELLNALASVEGLNVAARTSSFSFTGKGASIKQIGDTLHVRHVLEGSVRRSGQKLRVTAQLIDVETGFHLFSRSYDREPKDIFDVQNEIAREIVAALLPRLGLGTDVELVRQGTSNLEAYNLWLKARAALISPSPETLRPAVQLLEQAIALDHKFADAWGDLSYANAYLSTWEPDPVPYAMDAEVAAAIALEYSPANVPALLTHAAISLVIHRDVAATDAYLQRARKAGGDRALWAYQYAYLLGGPMGRYEEAIAALQDAAKTDPLAPNLKWALIEMYLPLGRVGEAVAAADELTRQGVKSPGSFVLVGLAYLAAGNVQAARDTLAKATATLGEDFPVTLLLQFAIFDATGDREGARRLLERLLAVDSDGRTVHPYVLGEGYKAVGDYDRALESWTRAVDQYRMYAYAFMPVRNRNHPVIGKNPRFLALLKRMGLEADRAARLPHPEVGT